MRIPDKQDTNKFNVFSDLLNDYKSGNLGRQRLLYKVQILEIDAEGGKFSANSPPKSIRGKILSSNLSVLTHDDDVFVFWPFMSEHRTYPIKCGEVVWCIFDDPELRSGWWLWRVRDRKPETLGIDVRADLDRKSEKKTPYYKEEEDIDPVKTRPDDNALLGDQGQYIRLGRDRVKERDTGSADAVIDMVVGPEGREVDFDKDSVRFFMATGTDNEIEGVGKTGIGLLIADNVLLLVRDKLRIKIKGSNSYIDMDKDKMVVNADNMDFGNNVADHWAVKGDDLEKALGEIMDAITAHVHPLPDGTSGASADLLRAIQKVMNAFRNRVGSTKSKIE